MINHPLDTNNSIRKQGKTGIFHHQKSSGKGYYENSDIIGVSEKEYLERYGLNNVECFDDKLTKLESKMSLGLNSTEPKKAIVLPKRTEKNLRWAKATKCWLCEQPFTP